jgi:hypothetical protein
MGCQSLIIGYIQEPDFSDKGKGNLVLNHNRAKILELGRLSDWPPLDSTFFSVSGESVTWSNSVIYFAGTFREIEWDWEKWLEKFENLLRNLVWKRVWLRLETELYGDYHYEWKASDEIIASFKDEFPKRVTEWSFSGEPRNFHLGEE